MLGGGIAGTGVAVQRSDFPFTRGFWIPKSFSVKSDGRFTTTIGPLWETTRLQLVTRTTNVATSPLTTIGVRVRVGLRAPVVEPPQRRADRRDPSGACRRAACPCSARRSPACG